MSEIMLTCTQRSHRRQEGGEKQKRMEREGEKHKLAEVEMFKLHRSGHSDIAVHIFFGQTH